MVKQVLELPDVIHREQGMPPVRYNDYVPLAETGEASVRIARRYPQRARHAPSQYNDYVPLTYFNVGHISSKEGAL